MNQDIYLVLYLNKMPTVLLAHYIYECGHSTKQVLKLFNIFMMMVLYFL